MRCHHEWWHHRNWCATPWSGSSSRGTWASPEPDWNASGSRTAACSSSSGSSRARTSPSRPPVVCPAGRSCCGVPGSSTVCRTVVGHALVDAWVEGDATVLVMRDLGDAVLTWDDRLDADRAAWLMQRAAALHRTFLGELLRRPRCRCSRRSGSSPRTTARPLAEQGIELMQLVLRGWELFAEEVPADVADAVFDAARGRHAVACGARAGPMTMNHGDLATVNMAIEGDTLVLIDWAMPTAAPGALTSHGSWPAVPRWSIPVARSCSRCTATRGTGVRRPLRAAVPARRHPLARLEQGSRRGRAPGRGGPRAGTCRPRLVGPASPDRPGEGVL